MELGREITSVLIVKGPVWAGFRGYHGTQELPRYSHGGDEVTISHLEFVTFDELVQFVKDLCGDKQKRASTFPVNSVLKIILED